MNFSRIEPAYTTKDGCRLIWQGIDEDDTDTIILNKKELESTIEILQKNTTGTIELEDQMSTILINSDIIQFNLKDHNPLEVPTFEFQKKVLEYAKIPHDPQYIYISSKEFYPSVWIRKDDAQKKEFQDKGNIKQSLLQTIFSATPQIIDHSDLFRVMSTRRSTRKFDKAKVEDWKIDKILAAADTAPTAGNFQGFEVFYIKNQKMKEALVESANKQPYVNAPVVLVFCMNPSRINLKFPTHILDKFSLQDATLAAAYSQLAASGVGLSSIWIGMFDEEKVKSLLGTNLRPSSILCLGYPDKKRPPKSRRNLKDLIKIIE